MWTSTKHKATYQSFHIVLKSQSTSPLWATIVWHITATNYSGKAVLIRWQLKNDWKKYNAIDSARFSDWLEGALPWTDDLCLFSIPQCMLGWAPWSWLGISRYRKLLNIRSRVCHEDTSWSGLANQNFTAAVSTVCIIAISGINLLRCSAVHYRRLSKALPHSVRFCKMEKRVSQGKHVLCLWSVSESLKPTAFKSLNALGTKAGNVLDRSVHHRANTETQFIVHSLYK